MHVDHRCAGRRGLVHHRRGAPPAGHPLHHVRHRVLPPGRAASAATPSAGAGTSTTSSCPAPARSGATPTPSTSRRRPTSRRPTSTSRSPSPRWSWPTSRWWSSARWPRATASTTSRVGADGRAGRRAALRGRRRRAPHLPLEAGDVLHGAAARADAFAVLGVGMHEWGKWGRPFHEYGIDAALAALDDAGIGWGDVQFVAGGETVRNGYPGYVAAATITQALGWNGARVATCYAACASGVTALDAARARILAGLCDVALVVGADTTPEGLPRPGRRRALGRPGLAALPPARRHQPHLLRALRPSPHGPLRRHRRRLRQGEGEERRATACTTRTPGTARRSPRRRCWPRRWWPTRSGCSRSAPPPTAPPRSCSRRWTTPGKHATAPVRIRAVSTVTPRFPNTVIEMPNFSTDSAAALAPPELTFRDSIAAAAYEEAGHRARRAEPGRGLRPVHRARARLVREHRALQARRGREAPQRRRHHHRRPRAR